MVLPLTDHDQRQDKWQVLARLLMSAAQADNPSLTAIVTHRIEEALRRPTCCRYSEEVANGTSQKEALG
jgi:hypothetical protein